MFAWTRNVPMRAWHHSNDFDKRTKRECYIPNEFLCFWVRKAWLPYNRPDRPNCPDRLKKFASGRDNPDDRGDYMEITGSPRIVPIVPNARSRRWGAWICQPSFGAKRFQNGGKKSQNRPCCDISNCIGSYTLKEITKKAPTWTWPYILLQKSPYVVQIYLYFFSASAASKLKVHHFFPDSFNLKS